jgi:hypothetical protein
MSKKFLATVTLGLAAFLIVTFVIVVHNPTFAGDYQDCVDRCNEQFSGCVYWGGSPKYCVTLFGDCLDICEGLYPQQ